MTTLSLAMIVKNEASTIERVLGAARTFCDEMIVVDTGSDDDTVARAAAMGASVHHFTWIDDFAAARNDSFSRCTGDWVIWLDGDDVVLEEDQERLRRFKEEPIPDECQAVYARYVYPPFRQWRERLVRRSALEAGVHWVEPIHEYLGGIDHSTVLFREDIRIMHETPPERYPLKAGRNIKILRPLVEQGRTDPRTLYLYTVECLHSRLRVEGESAIRIFFDAVESIEYRYEILIKMYDFFVHFGDRSRAAEAVSQAIAEDPGRAEAYYKLGRHLSDLLDRPAQAIPLFTLAAGIETPHDGTIESEAYGWGPLAGLAHAHFRLGDRRSAGRAAFAALRAGAPHSPFLMELAEQDRPVAEPEALPAEWQEWATSNLERGVPQGPVLRLLAEGGFLPHRIAAALPQLFQDSFPDPPRRVPDAPQLQLVAG